MPLLLPPLTRRLRSLRTGLRMSPPLFPTQRLKLRLKLKTCRPLAPGLPRDLKSKTSLLHRLPAYNYNYNNNNNNNMRHPQAGSLKLIIRLGIKPWAGRPSALT
jgi:hypothetical protein